MQGFFLLLSASESGKHNSAIRRCEARAEALYLCTVESVLQTGVM